MPEKRLRVLLSFTHGSDHDVVDIAGTVVAGMKGNPAFPDPNVDPAVVQTALTEFIAAISTASQGGPKDTAAKDKKRLELVGLLRHLAYYVQTTCNDDLAKLLSSGFLSKSSNRASTPLPTPNILNIIQGNTGQLLVTVKAVRNARSYDLCYAVSLSGGNGTSGSWQTVSGFTSSRSMPINGLTPARPTPYRRAPWALPAASRIGATRSATSAFREGRRSESKAVGNHMPLGHWSDAICHIGNRHDMAFDHGPIAYMVSYGSFATRRAAPVNSRICIPVFARSTM